MVEPTETLPLRRVTNAVGARIDIDLAAEHEEHVYRDIRRAIADRGVVFFHDQDLSSEQFVAFARHFGKPMVPTSNIIPALEGHTEIAEIRKEPDQTRNVGGAWHTDQSFRPHPYWGTILLAREAPDFGGDTLFIDMSAAYAALSDGLKETLDGLNAVHSNAAVQAKMATGKAPEPEVVHPAVAKSAFDGRPILYVNPAYTLRFEGWSEEESRPLLDYLFRHARRAEFCCRFRWREGAMAFWDNHQTWHYAANDYHGQQRVMHRIVVEGEMFS